MEATINGVDITSYLPLKTGKNSEGWLTNKDLNEQIDVNYVLFRHYHPVEKYDLCLAFDDSMTHKAKSPDGVDAYKNRSDEDARLQVGMPFILKARGKLASRYRMCVSWSTQRKITLQ